jgi:hypothetical protein
MNNIRIKDDDVLECPHCPNAIESYLHHGKVTVYARHEDAPRVTKIEVNNGVAHTNETDDNGSGNPSFRRDGVAICFECELCGRTSELTIAQHKGQSLLAWRGGE